MIGLPVVSDDGDGRAAQSNVDEETGEVKAEERCDRGRGGIAGGDDAAAALRRGGGSNRGSGPRHGGSKGLLGKRVSGHREEWTAVIDVQ
jgi:hypothetical protein